MFSIVISIFLGKAWAEPRTREMSRMRYFVRRPAVASVILLAAASLAAGGCGSNSSTADCLSKHAAGAAAAANGRQLWNRTLARHDPQGIDMAPRYNNGTVPVAAGPVNPAVGEYLGHAKGALWALNARAGAPEWSWDEVQDLWGNPGINSG